MEETCCEEAIAHDVTENLAHQTWGEKPPSVQCVAVKERQLIKDILALKGIRYHSAQYKPRADLLSPSQQKIQFLLQFNLTLKTGSINSVDGEKDKIIFKQERKKNQDEEREIKICPQKERIQTSGQKLNA